MVSRNKFGLTPVIASLMLLLVTVTATISMSVWFDEYSDRFAEKRMQEHLFDSRSIETMIIRNESFMNLYVKNQVNGYKKIERLILNGEDCVLFHTNVIANNQITVIPIECNLIKEVNTVEFLIDNKFITKTVRLEE